MEPLWWMSWAAVGRAAVLAATGYAGLLLMLRTAGKRATAKMNMFDWVVTVALGSMLATLILSESIPLAVGLAGTGTLIVLQMAISWAHVRFPRLQSLITSEPTLLYYRGEFLDDRLKAERISEADVQSKARTAGFPSMERVYAVALEPDAEMSVIGQGPEGAGDTLLDDLELPGRQAAGPSPPSTSR